MLGPALLLVVALGQQAVARVTDLSPWMGGGFGMFSTSDRPNHRILDASITTADGDVLPVDMEAWAALDGTNYDEQAVRTLPVSFWMDRMARSIGSRSWELVDDVLVPDAEDSELTVEPDQIVTVTVIVSRLDHHPATDTARVEQLADHTWSR